MTLLELVKARCGVPAPITVYDAEFTELIADAIDDMSTGGVPAPLLEDKGEGTNPRVLTAIVLYVKAHRGDDRTDTELYMQLYDRKVFKLSLFPPEPVPIIPPVGGD